MGDGARTGGVVHRVARREATGGVDVQRGGNSRASKPVDWRKRLRSDPRPRQGESPGAAYWHPNDDQMASKCSPNGFKIRYTSIPKVIPYATSFVYTFCMRVWLILKATITPSWMKSKRWFWHSSWLLHAQHHWKTIGFIKIFRFHWSSFAFTNAVKSRTTEY